MSAIALSDLPPTMWHASPRDKRASIEAEGLRPMAPGEGERWDDAQRRWLRERAPTGVYVWTDLDDAQEFAKGWGGLDLWAVSAEQIREVLLDPDQMAALCIPHTVRATRVA